VAARDLLRLSRDGPPAPGHHGPTWVSSATGACVRRLDALNPHEHFAPGGPLLVGADLDGEPERRNCAAEADELKSSLPRELLEGPCRINHGLLVRGCVIEADLGMDTALAFAAGESGSKLELRLAVRDESS